MTPAELLSAYERMLLIRRFEEAASTCYRNGEIPGFVHLCIGQEATAVGACWHLGNDDIITSTHRGHGHCLAKGLDPAPMFAELFGRDAGTCRGRGGSMHIADPELGIFGANGIVAAGIPIAVGAALAQQLRSSGRVVVAMFGDGAVAQGAFHEAVNLASLWSLPVAFFCENNHYAEFSAERDQQPVTLAERAAGYGLRHLSLDGDDVVTVADAMGEVISGLRAGSPPVIVEADTYRWHGHYEGDPERYRDVAETDERRVRDPLLLARTALVRLGTGEADLDAASDRVERAVEEALTFARSAPAPDPSTLGLYVKRNAEQPTEPTLEVDAPVFRNMDAVRLALEHELETDPSVFVAGVDVGKGGNVFGLTRGLHDRWPDRVRDTPISETALVGLAVGASMAGMRPVVELMYVDFLGVCLDQLMNQAAKLGFMTGGRAGLSMVLRTQFGAGRSSGSQHSQSLEALLAHIPGLTVVMPSTPADTYGLLRSAIRDPNPIVFIEHRLLYGRKGPQPPADHLVPIGKAVVRRRGLHVTVVSMSRMVLEVEAAADELANEGIEAEVIDLRTVAPLDMETVLASVEKTSRLLVVHEAVRDFGIGAEIAAGVAEQAFWHLDAPVARLAPPPMPVPYAPELEHAWLPDRERISAAIRDVAHA